MLWLDDVAELYIDALNECGEKEAKESLKFYASCFADEYPSSGKKRKKRVGRIYMALRHRTERILRVRKIERYKNQNMGMMRILSGVIFS